VADYRLENRCDSARALAATFPSSEQTALWEMTRNLGTLGGVWRRILVRLDSCHA